MSFFFLNKWEIFFLMAVGWEGSAVDRGAFLIPERWYLFNDTGEFSFVFNCKHTRMRYWRRVWIQWETYKLLLKCLWTHQKSLSSFFNRASLFCTFLYSKPGSPRCLKDWEVLPQHSSLVLAFWAHGPSWLLAACWSQFYPCSGSVLAWY